jgi:N4-(beta-N-acetylglucosaminyl)-L-asparaginase
MDAEGRLAGACTTSGLAFKTHGRVGDSPIIGAGLYVDGDVAAAVATGDGELMMRTCASFHIVEQVRQGLEPGEALERTLTRIRHDKHLRDDMQCGLMVIRADGAWSARSLRAGFQLAAASSELQNRNVLYDVTENHLTESVHG